MHRDVLRAKVAAYLDDCFTRETAPRVAELSTFLGISRAHLTDLALSKLHESPSGYLKRMQMERAIQLIRTSELTFTRIAYMCGFGTRRTLFRSFQRVHRCSPGALRREAAAASADRMSLARERRSR